ncbi:hypothetical protein CASFOL_012134 [Castilleja foliolosa]|uniref:Knottins-like domain-containing protein n=1 Tax=Castilleja foliolosa TaxID=1961234 RepID=A0ABD3DQ37_9LAMI
MGTSTKFFALVLCFLLIASYEMAASEAYKICQKMSKTWSGPCSITSRCNNQCRKWEKAKQGACHWKGFGFACFCYFKC